MNQEEDLNVQSVVTIVLTRVNEKTVAYLSGWQNLGIFVGNSEYEAVGKCFMKILYHRTPFVEEYAGGYRAYVGDNWAIGRTEAIAKGAYLLRYKRYQTKYFNDVIAIRFERRY